MSRVVLLHKAVNFCKECSSSSFNIIKLTLPTWNLLYLVGGVGLAAAEVMRPINIEATKFVLYDDS